jgi:sugar porter (SP) family MFS transporter
MVDPRILSSLICVIVGGSLVGYSTGYVSVALAWYNVVSNCTGIATQPACEWVGSSGPSGCVWVNDTAAPAHCAFSTGGACATTTDEAACKADSRCSWDPNVNTCSHVASWDANEQGWIATTMIIGGLVGSMLGEPFVHKLGLKRSMVVTGILAAVSTVCIFIGWSLNDPAKRFALFLVFRTVNGISVGFASIFCPMYVGDVAPKAISVKIGVCFQVFLTFGIMLAAGLGWAIEPKAPTDTDDIARFQTLNAVNMLISVAMIPMGALVMTPAKESVASQRPETGDEDPMRSLLQAGDDGGAAGTRFWFTKMMWGGVMLSVVQQLCGINAIMNYVPSMATTVGVSNPFLSNFVVMIWNFVTSLVAIPIAERTSPEFSYVVGTVVASIACFITGIPTYPGVTESETTRNGLVIFGILLFILAFEVGMGPPFYVLAQSMFPERVRAKGCSFTMAIQFLFNIGVNYGFPVLVEAFSGGASGDQKKGLAIMFFIFGGVSIVAIIIFKLLGVKHQPVEQPTKFELDA